MRPVAAVAAASALMAALLTSSLSAAASTDDEGGSAWSDPTVVVVPYLSDTTVAVNAAWSLTACPELDTQGIVELACTDEGDIILTATRYSASVSPWPLLLEVLDSTGAARTVPLTVTLGPPDPPELATSLPGIVGLAGGRTLIPVSAFVTSCTLCTTGLTLEVTTVVDTSAPATPVPPRAWVSQHHVVIDAPAEATSVTLSVRAADDTGTLGPPAEVTLPVRRTSSPTTALHLLRAPDASGSLTLDAAEFVLPDGDDWRIDRCGRAVEGAVACTESTFTYRPQATTASTDTPSGTALADQVWVRLRSSTNDVVTASVTVVEGATGLAAAAPLLPHIVPVATAKAAPPTDSQPASDPGVLAAFWGLLPPLTAVPGPSDDTPPTPHEEASP